jgi:hypothetical protein
MDMVVHIPTLGRLSQKDDEFEVCLDYIAKTLSQKKQI